MKIVFSQPVGLHTIAQRCFQRTSTLQNKQLDFPCVTSKNKKKTLNKHENTRKETKFKEEGGGEKLLPAAEGPLSRREGARASIHPRDQVGEEPRKELALSRYDAYKLSN